MKPIRITTFLLLAILLAASLLNARAQSDTPTAFVLEIEGALTPSQAEYLERALAEAEKQSAALVILKLNTPGGAVDLMSRMVEAIRQSTVPVVVFVAPRGAMAGSAGTVITLAGHFSAMAPETAIGAASPVDMEGGDIDETLQAKIKEIIKAQIRSITEGRLSPEAIALAEDTVESATAVSAREALEIGLVQFIADDIPGLLRQLDGQTAETVSGKVTLETSYLQVEEFSPTLIEELLTILTNPNIVFLLLSIGVQAIIIEIGSPGGWFAGFLGVVCLSLAAYGLGFLPVNWFGLIFIATAFVLFILDVKAPTHGALTAAGVGSFIAGALLLFNSSNTPSFFHVSVPLVVAMGVLTAGVFLAATAFALKAQRQPARMGGSSLIGQTGRARDPIAPQQPGQVHLASELWTAELAADSPPVDVGDDVEVVEVLGLRLKVRKSGE
ncbi:MAG: nodulation protein NfeD [Anaerolineales bacterium]|nr:nodulation protein NfeD [Anaerolineales bacterium]